MRLSSLFLAVASGLFIAGCATERQVASLEGHGDRRVYNAPFDQVWRSAIVASQRGDLEIMTADRASGYIGARRTVQPHTFDENVGVWVHSLGPSQTEMEVASRQAGPPVLWLKNREHEIHRSVAANLTRESAVGTAPRQTGIQTGPGETRVIVPGTPDTTVTTSDSWSTQQRRVEAFRAERDYRLAAMRAENDDARRDAIEREVDRLSSDLCIEEQRLQDLRGNVR